MEDPESIYNNRAEIYRQKEVLLHLDEEIAEKHEDDFDADTSRKTLDQINNEVEGNMDPHVRKLDAELLVKVSTTFVHKVEKDVKESRGVDLPGFLRSIKKKNLCKDGPYKIDFDTVGRRYGYHFNGIFQGSFLNGTLDVQRKQRKAAVKIKRNEAELTKPDEMKPQANGQPKKRDHHEMMQSRILKKIKETKGSSNLLELTLNPKSFTQSVENLFEYSFLVKEKSKLRIGKDGVPIVTVSSYSSTGSDDEDENNGLGHQSVLTFNMKDWAKGCETLCSKADDKMLPHRNDPIYKDTF